MANMGDDNSDFINRNKTSNSRVTCFIIVYTIALMIINLYIIFILIIRHDLH